MYALLHRLRFMMSMAISLLRFIPQRIDYQFLLKDVPKDLQNAFVATEDSRLYPITVSTQLVSYVRRG